MIVVDVNIVAGLFIESDGTEQIHVLREKDAEWITPPFWRIEFQSILWKYVQFGGMPEADAFPLYDRAAAVMSPHEIPPSAHEVLRNALRFKISVYDAQYVALAKQMNSPCVTLDEPLRNKCPDRVSTVSEYIGV